MTMKTCEICGGKEFYEYHARSSCKECQSSMASENHIDWRLRALMVLGGKCVRCGENDPMVLLVDHVHGGGHEERRTRPGQPRKMDSSTLYRKIALGEVPLYNYQALCWNDSARKKHEEKEVNGKSRVNYDKAKVRVGWPGA